MTTEIQLDPAIEQKINETVAAKFAELLESNLRVQTETKQAAKPKRKQRRPRFRCL